MSEFAVQSLLETPTVTVRDVYCKGSCRGQSAEECATDTQLVFPYRGVYVRRLGRDEAVAEANQALFFNAAEGYQVSHPVPGGDASLTLIISEPDLRELAPLAFMRDGAALALRQQRPDRLSTRIDPQALLSERQRGAVAHKSEWRQFAQIRFADDQCQTGVATRHGVADLVTFGGVEK